MVADANVDDTEKALIPLLEFPLVKYLDCDNRGLFDHAENDVSNVEKNEKRGLTCRSSQSCRGSETPSDESAEALTPIGATLINSAFTPR